MWAALGLAVLGEIYVAFLMPRRDFDTGDLFVVPFMGAVIFVVFESIYRLTNYLFFHAQEVHYSTSVWAGKHSRRSIKLAYEAIDSVELDSSRKEIVISYRPLLWKGKYGIHRQEFRMRPLDPSASFYELQRRVEMARMTTARSSVEASERA